MCVNIAVPGVKAADLSVDVVDGELRVKGETNRGTETYRIDRRLCLPHVADLDTVRAYHADGMLTITIQRKAGKRVTIQQCQEQAEVSITKDEGTTEVHADGVKKEVRFHA